uniref:Uncharacterized protein n=1 Tax=Anser cygnoides TaxID=8845 RepID=A0A8B9E5X1_ANSCY
MSRAVQGRRCLPWARLGPYLRAASLPGAAGGSFRGKILSGDSGSLPRSCVRHQGGSQGPPAQRGSSRHGLDHLRTVASSDAIKKHQKSLAAWFSNQPNEERQFGPSFSLDAVHVDPVIRESSLEQILKPSPELTIQHQLQRSSRQVISLQNLFDVDACGRQVKNVVLYGTVGTGKSTLIKKMVVDWCHGLLPRFELVIPFSCEDLSHSRVPISLRRLVTKKYQHLRDVAPILGASNLKVLFILNGLERLNLDFRLAGTELCCDPGEPIAPSAIVVNLLRKYLLPEASIIVTTRPSAVRRIPGKYVGRYAEICGFSDTNLQKLYFQMRLSQPGCGGGDGEGSGEQDNLVEMLSRNLERQNQIAAACFLPSYCWLLPAAQLQRGGAGQHRPHRHLHDEVRGQDGGQAGPRGGDVPQDLLLGGGPAAVLRGGDEDRKRAQPPGGLPQRRLPLLPHAVRAAGQGAHLRLHHPRHAGVPGRPLRGAGREEDPGAEGGQGAVGAHREGPGHDRSHHGGGALQRGGLLQRRRLGPDQLQHPGRGGPHAAPRRGPRRRGLRALPHLHGGAAVPPQPRHPGAAGLLHQEPGSLRDRRGHEEDRHQEQPQGAAPLGADGLPLLPARVPERALHGRGRPLPPDRQPLVRQADPAQVLRAGVRHGHGVPRGGRAQPHLLQPGRRQLEDPLPRPVAVQSPPPAAQQPGPRRLRGAARPAAARPVRGERPAAVQQPGGRAGGTAPGRGAGGEPLAEPPVPAARRAGGPGRGGDRRAPGRQPAAAGAQPGLQRPDGRGRPARGGGGQEARHAGQSAFVLQRHQRGGQAGAAQPAHGPGRRQGARLPHGGHRRLRLLVQHPQHRAQEPALLGPRAGSPAPRPPPAGPGEQPETDGQPLEESQVPAGGERGQKDAGEAPAGDPVSCCPGREETLQGCPCPCPGGDAQRSGAAEAVQGAGKFEFNPKDGIDNPALSLAEDTDGEAAGEPRFYLLSKGSAETFGFCLHEELGSQGHVVRQVELGGLAQRRGLQDGDRLLQVNGHFVDHLDHQRVVQKIKASGNQVLLAVLDGDSYEAAKALGRDLAQLLPADVRPRLCHVKRDKSGFGFSVSGPEGTKGMFQLSVRQDGPADRAGVPTGSWLLELNGASVRSCSRSQLARKLKQSGSKMTLLVASSAVEEFYRLRGLQAPAASADTSWLPYRARELRMAKGPGGYGFLLKEDDYGAGAIGQFLWEVDAGLPAEQAGMKEGDRVLAVNGESIEGLDHQETVLRIRAHEDRVTLLVIDPASDEFYRSVGLSPLLFLEDGDPASGSCTPSLPSPHGSPGLCHVDVGPKGPGSWLVAAANSITITQSPRKEEQRRLREAF